MRKNNKLHFNVGKDRIVEDSEKKTQLYLFEQRRFIEPKSSVVVKVMRMSQEV